MIQSITYEIVEWYLSLRESRWSFGWAWVLINIGHTNFLSQRDEGRIQSKTGDLLCTFLLAMTSISLIFILLANLPWQASELFRCCNLFGLS